VIVYAALFCVNHVITQVLLVAKVSCCTIICWSVDENQFMGVIVTTELACEYSVGHNCTPSSVICAILLAELIVKSPVSAVTCQASGLNTCSSQSDE